MIPYTNTPPEIRTTPDLWDDAFKKPICLCSKQVKSSNHQIWHFRATIRFLDNLCKYHGCQLSTLQEKTSRTDPKLGYFINGLMVSSPVLRHIELDESVEIPWRRIPASTSFRLVVQLLNGGHIMEPPYFPHHDKVNAKFQGVFCGYGGDIVLHGKSQELSWVRTIEFFTRTLGKPANMPEWKRLQPECIRCNL
ncbi:hypothetical protein RB195_019162 [Necator americanus]|uniref:BAAT/Acyl-CoA thioester hydrolase C-terminal domain-containing protein n=1 Tax=Necator americanus TaxID=51031 RepID=A0ABR1CEW6_NECAM